MNPLTPAQRRALRAKAHHLQPVVTIGQHGLTPPVLHEIDLALTKHELIKVRVFSDERDQREAMLAQVCADMDCAAVQHLGKVLVVWRPNPELHKPAAARPRPGRDQAGGQASQGRAHRAAHARRSRARTPPRSAVGRRPVGKGTRGAARFNAPDGDFAPPRPAAKGARAATGGTVRGAAGTSRQKIRARGAAKAHDDLADPRFAAPAARRKSTLHAQDQAASPSAPSPIRARRGRKSRAAGSAASAASTPRRRRKA